MTNRANVSGIVGNRADQQLANQVAGAWRPGRPYDTVADLVRLPFLLVTPKWKLRDRIDWEVRR